MLSVILTILIGQQNPAGLALPHTAKVDDVVEFSSPSQVQLGGLLGERYAASERARLPYVDEDELLSGFRHRPGKQAWIGEHVGKWLHAASLTYLAHRDPALKAKMDRVVRGLLATQEADGYLGTYPPDKRFSLAEDADWDVWVHKYCMIGLLSYYQATHDGTALESARRIGDLLVKTFGPNGRYLSQAGQHEGMAATSVLEPIVLLYRATGDSRYLQFGRRIVESFDELGGSHIVRDLLSTGSVAQTANGKAYEMLSNLVGLVELYRATGEIRYLKPVQIAWEDIVKRRLYITGTGSTHEVWTNNCAMPNGEGDNVGETCVTVTWIQLNLELLRLGGQPKYVDQVERSIYNHLFAAQRPDGAAWCYYTPLEGKRHPGTETTCCLSSGPWGIALLPVFAYAKRFDGIDVNLFGASSYSGALHLRQTGGYPFSPDIRIRVDKGSISPLTLRLRIPAWALNATVNFGGSSFKRVIPGEYLSHRKTWRSGDEVRLHFPMPIETVDGSGSNVGRRAFMAGPLVFAADSSLLPDATHKGRFVVGNNATRRSGDDHINVAEFVAGNEGSRVPQSITLIPFFRAGASGAWYSVWLRTKESPPASESLFYEGEPSQSRMGNQRGSFADGDPLTNSDTFTGKPAVEDWFALTIAEPKLVGRVVFRHGASYHDGGWFDSSAGKPKVQVQRSTGGPWETIGILKTYPLSDASHDPGIKRGQAFEFRFQPIKVLGIRVIGKPSHGDNPSQNFSSCAELEAYRS